MAFSGTQTAHIFALVLFLTVVELVVVFLSVTLPHVYQCYMFLLMSQHKTPVHAYVLYIYTTILPPKIGEKQI